MAEKIAIIDVETTGTNHWQHSIHQISGMIIIDGEIKETFDFKVAPHPKAKIDPKALEVSGVTEEQIRAYPPQATVYAQLIDIFSKYVDKYDKLDKFFFAGYNAIFDNNFVRAFFVQNGDEYFGSWFWAGCLDAMVLALYILTGVRHKMKNFQLATVAEFLGIEVDESKLHDATYDNYLTYQVLLKCNLSPA